MVLTGREQALGADAHLAAVLELCGDAILRVSLDGIILGWSASAERIYGWPAGEAEGRRVSLVEPLDRADEAARLLERAARGESILSHETVHVQKSGRRVQVSLTLGPVRDAAGAVATACLIVRDLSGVRRLEEQLRQAQKMEAVGRLATGVAHDFNNLLTVIHGYGQMVMDDLDPAHTARGHLDEVLKAAHCAAGLARQLLAFCRRQPVQTQLVDLNQSVTGIEKMLRRLLTENIELKTMLSPEPARIKADPGQVEQVIVNLVVNACDAMPHGGVITVETKLIEGGHPAAFPGAPGPGAVLAVRDTGRGMDSETQMRLFEPFFTTKEAGKGTGLGLSMVYEIVTQSGGQISVESEPGQGSSFRLFFPRAEEPAAIATEPPSADAARGEETVLLVEDEPDVRALVRRVLHRQGYTVLEAASGEEALEVCGRYQGHIALLITDVVMREMSGRELFERVAPFRPEMRVVYMSGYPDDAIAHHGVCHPETPFIRKPFTLPELASKVREVLDRAAHVGAAQRTFGFSELRRGAKAKSAGTVIH